MNKSRARKSRRFARYIRRTLKNKLYALAILVVAIVSIPLLEGEGTIFVLFTLFAIPMFFAKDNWFD